MRTKLTSVLLTQVVTATLIFLMLFPKSGAWADIIWIIFASFFLLYLPGYWIGYIFFGEDDLLAFERFIINFLISITLLILVSYYLYYAGVGVSNIKIYVIFFGILFISVCAALIRWRNYPDTIEIDEVDDE